MNRDIEFRGMHSNKWLYGYLVKSVDDNKFYITVSTDQFYQVREETIGQYTGLKDKNGKKIFEGDILRTPAWLYGEEKVCICKYNQENNVNSIIGFGLYTNDAYFKKYQELVECDEWDEFEVIGNIYENKELLEG